jgi:hypothetical protein
VDLDLLCPDLNEADGGAEAPRTYTDIDAGAGAGAGAAGDKDGSKTETVGGAADVPEDKVRSRLPAGSAIFAKEPRMDRKLNGPLFLIVLLRPWTEWNLRLE